MAKIADTWSAGWGYLRGTACSEEKVRRDGGRIVGGGDCEASSEQDVKWKKLKLN